MRADEIAKPGVGADVGLLDDVLGLGGVAQDAARQAEQAPVVAAHDQLEGDRIAGPRPLDQQTVDGLRRGARRRKLDWLCVWPGHGPQMGKAPKRSRKNCLRIDYLLGADGALGSVGQDRQRVVAALEALRLGRHEALQDLLRQPVRGRGQGDRR